jgi:hypothetical protein
MTEGEGGRGEFTRKFDRDVLKDEKAGLEELEAQKKRQKAEESAVDGELKKLDELLAYRAGWLRDRFKTMVEPKIDFRGRRFEFEKLGNAGPGWLEFKCRQTDTGLGIILESFMLLEGKFKKKYDYVTFPKTGVDVDRAKKFIESKIFEFALAYQG